MRGVPPRPTSTEMALRFCGAALLAACAVAAAGCGGARSTSAVAGEPISFEQLSASASTSAEKTSGRFSFDLAATLPGADEPFSFSGEGAFDEASGRASFAVDMSSLAKLLGGFVAGFGGAGASDLPDFDDPAGWKIEVVKDGNVEYLRFPAVDDKLPAGKSWIRGTGGNINAAGIGLKELDSFTHNDPRDVLDALRALDGEVETVGTEELRGVETTRYRVLLDPTELAKQATREQGAASDLLDQLGSQAAVGKVPLDVWIDAGGLVRKLSLHVAADQGSSRTGEVSLAFELWDYGEHVEIDVPSASQVVDAAAVRG
jgi:hypothetical protein